MIFPEEYKHVGVCRTGDDRTDRVYFLSRYLVCQHDSGWRLYSVRSSEKPILTHVDSLELIADTHEIIWYDEKLNIKNRRLLIETAARLCSGEITTVIFTGIDEHITFIHRPDTDCIRTIQVLDIEPPLPWLADCIRRLDNSGLFSDLEIRFEEKITDLHRFQGKDTVFPCCCSGLEGQFLDSDLITRKKVTLIGCEISDSIFRSRYPDKEYTRRSFCPFSCDLVTPDSEFIARCCRKEMCGPAVINGYRGRVVHWGATEYEIAEAVRELAMEMNNEKDCSN
ncbi:conserved hypothetical protein [Methanosalsum zhilinae DSM 4017]|uniref:Uncharacterized protein n=1 Tax=Methanosalsum zhilinae (strain DSM 4017 / NBRC 107636 / OCM 62 / WeN5) TaxID=679901 RepID=F7XPX5_METZD|nr:hypothetical protein [Methanosalsum zhilinae]AEH61496.1 conserved hypothetical protein [Methanosalsum zhilinae DSM 4017]